MIDSFAKVLEYAKLYCKKIVTDLVYTLWIDGVYAIKLEKNIATIGVETSFKKEILQNKYADLFSEAIESVLGFPVEVEFSYTDLEKHNEQLLKASKPDVNTCDHGNYDYTFENFVVGQSNKFAHAASLAVASNPGKTYNPLFIYGNSGLGKSHLLCAIKKTLQSERPDFKVLYVQGEQFTNELIDAIRTGTTNRFHDKYRSLDVLLVDDIQFISGKESTQEEFFHTFNTLYESKKQIILSSDRPPKEIKILEERLRNRFEWGLLADVQPPDFETRMVIIKRKAQLLNMDIPREVEEFVANKLKTNIRQLEGAVKKMKAYETMTNSPASISTAQKTINDILSDNQPVSVTLDRILTEVGRTFEITPEDIKSDNRSGNISNARQVSIYVIREVLHLPLTSIGENLGNRDHSTIVYAIKQVEKKMSKDSNYKATIEDIVKNMKNI